MIGVADGPLRESFDPDLIRAAFRNVDRHVLTLARSVTLARYSLPFDCSTVTHCLLAVSLLAAVWYLSD
jgi:hypothetical protein